MYHVEKSKKYQKVPLGTSEIVATDFNPLKRNARNCSNGF